MENELREIEKWSSDSDDEQTNKNIIYLVLFYSPFHHRYQMTISRFLQVHFPIFYMRLKNGNNGYLKFNTIIKFYLHCQLVSVAKSINCLSKEIR